MKSFIFLSLFFMAAYAQTPEKGFEEMSPEQIKKIEYREQKKKEFLLKKAAEEKRKIEEAKIAAQKKQDELNKKAEEEKKLAEEKKKKEEVEAYTKWLISERDRKMKEASEKAQIKPSQPSEAVKTLPVAGSRSDRHSRSGPVTIYHGNATLSGHHSGQVGHGGMGGLGRGGKGGSGKNKAPVNCSKNEYTKAWEKEFRNLRGELIGVHPVSSYNTVTENTLQEFLCSCRFSGNVKFPANAKVIGISGYEGVYRDSPRTSGMHTVKDVSIKVNSNGPVMLALDVYEPVHWKISGPVAGVLILGFHKQTISIEGNVPILKSQMLADEVQENNQFEPGNNVCKTSDPALLAAPPMSSVEGHKMLSGYEESGREKILNDRSLLVFGRKLSSFRYSYGIPETVEINP